MAANQSKAPGMLSFIVTTSFADKKINQPSPMPTVAEAMSAALSHHQAGRLGEAEQLYRQILAVDPNHAVAWHLLGVIASQLGRNDAAEKSIGRALELQPNYAEARNNLGLAYRRKESSTRRPPAISGRSS